MHTMLEALIEGLAAQDCSNLAMFGHPGGEVGLGDGNTLFLVFEQEVGEHHQSAV